MSDRDSILAEQEVDDELRRERLVGLWKAYGKFIIGGAVGVVLFVAGSQYYTWQTENAERENAGRLAAAVERAQENNVNLIAFLTETVPQLNDGYKAIAQLQIAAAQVEERDFRSAIATYDDLAADSSADNALTSLAQLLAAMIMVSEQGDLDGARTRLSNLAVEGRIWYFSALEQLALIDLQQGDETGSLASFRLLANSVDTPPSITERARQFVALIERSTNAETLETAPSESTSEETIPEDIKDSESEGQ